MMDQAERKAFNSQFWRFLWSAILIALSGCLGNVVDAIIVGNLIGEDAVSAINLTRPVVQFMYTLNMLLATGAGILVGVEIGKKDMSRAAYFYTLSMAACLIVGLLITAAGLFCPGTVTGWLCSNARLVVQQCPSLPADVRVSEYYADWCPCIYDDVGPFNDGRCGWQSETRLYCHID